MSLDILKRQKSMLMRRAIVRSYVKSAEKHCPICDKRKNLAKTMKELKEQSYSN